MKQKIVIGMDLRCEKLKRKAIKIAIAATPGALDMCSVEGTKSDRLVVVGDGLDPVCLVRALRKKVGPASVVSVDTKKKEEDKKEDDHGYVRCPYSYPQPQVVVYGMPTLAYETSSCIVM